MVQQLDVLAPPTRWWPCLSIVLALAGCASSQTRRYDALNAELRRAASEREPPREHLEWDEIARLDREAFIRAVLARNPSIESARQGWRAALAQYPQARTLDDPRIEYALAPLSIGARDVAFGQEIRVSQRFPWPGKLAFEGEVALAEAEAARDNYEATRLSLALVASLLFDQYYAIARSIELNEEHHALVEDIQSIAQAQYEAGRAPQQEPLQAEVELAQIRHHQIVLESRRAVIVAQMNGLLHRRPDLPLPPPPEHLEPVVRDVTSSQQLQEEALQSRPELRASQAEIRGREAAIDRARREYYPDIGVMTSYNSMWMDYQHRWMVGLSLNIPIQIGARRGAVDQAEARLAQAEAQLLSVADEVRVQVEGARQRLIEAQHVVKLYQDRLLPASRAQIEAAQIGYETGRASFQALIDAERSLRTLELGYQEALAELGQRRAELERAIGQLPWLTDERRQP